MEGNTEFCKVLLSQRRAADCGVPSRSEFGLGAGKTVEGCKDAGREILQLIVVMVVQVTVCTVQV